MIGVIADDVTGATDVAAALSRAGQRTMLSLTPQVGGVPSDADAIVIGLKTRSMPVWDAVDLSLEALEALLAAGADRLYVKYCSTFDSTPEGNIGPITDAIAKRLGVRTVVTTPAAPLHGRTVYRGHLFVGDALLDETHMREHPVTPMRDSSVLRLLSPQTRGGVGLLAWDVVQAGADAIRGRIAEAQDAGHAHLVADAVSETDLARIAEAVDGIALVAGSAGLIGAIARRQPRSAADLPQTAAGRTAIIAGSCSQRTLEQIERFRAQGGASFHVVAREGDTAEQIADRAVQWWDAQPDGASAMLYSSSPADERNRHDPKLGALYEDVAGRIASQLAERGVRRLLVAGGETSGEVIKALGTRIAVVGEEVALGAPWVHDVERGLQLVLKSGNFGPPDLFVEVAAEGGA